MIKSKLSATGEKGDINQERILPLTPFYDLKDTANNSKEISFTQFKGRKVLLVNTASNCGFTPQYEQLQQLHERYGDKLAVIGFPANDFKEQEKGSDEDIAEFCKVNYGVTFALMKKSSVIKGIGQNSVFRWLSDAGLNGWNDKEPTWNFTKYLVDENGILIGYFPPQVSPLDEEIVKSL